MKAEMKSHIRGAFGLLWIVVLFLAVLYILGTHVHAQGGGQAGTLPASPAIIGASPGLGLVPVSVYQASTPTTPVTSTNILASAPAGQYRVGIYYVVTTAGTVGTAITVNVTYTDAQQAQTNSTLTSSGLVQGQFVQGFLNIQQQAAGNIAYTVTETGSFTVHPVLALKVTLERIQ